MSAIGPSRSERPVIAHNTEGSRETHARTALEERFGRSFSEDEWRLYRSRLIEFARLLRAWETTG